MVSLELVTVQGGTTALWCQSSGRIYLLQTANCGCNFMRAPHHLLLPGEGGVLQSPAVTEQGGHLATWTEATGLTAPARLCNDQNCSWKRAGGMASDRKPAPGSEPRPMFTLSLPLSLPLICWRGQPNPGAVPGSAEQPPPVTVHDLLWSLLKPYLWVTLDNPPGQQHPWAGTPGHTLT